MSKSCEKVTIKIYYVTMRDVSDILWCALCTDQKPLYWYDGKLVCMELKENMDRKVIHLANMCIGECKKYSRVMRIDSVRGVPSTYVPVIKACGLYADIIERGLKCLNRETDMKGNIEKKHG